jgi:hypothetical protein
VVACNKAKTNPSDDSGPVLARPFRQASHACWCTATGGAQEKSISLWIINCEMISPLAILGYPPILDINHQCAINDYTQPLISHSAVIHRSGVTKRARWWFHVSFVDWLKQLLQEDHWLCPNNSYVSREFSIQLWEFSRFNQSLKLLQTINQAYSIKHQTINRYDQPIIFIKYQRSVRHHWYHSVKDYPKKPPLRARPKAAAVSRQQQQLAVWPGQTWVILGYKRVIFITWWNMGFMGC